MFLGGGEGERGKSMKRSQGQELLGEQTRLLPVSPSFAQQQFRQHADRQAEQADSRIINKHKRLLCHPWAKGLWGVVIQSGAQQQQGAGSRGDGRQGQSHLPQAD